MLFLNMVCLTVALAHALVFEVIRLILQSTFQLQKFRT
jgi:hypothetical protein